MSSNRRWQFWKNKPTRSQSQQTKTQTKTGAQWQLGDWFTLARLGHLLVGVVSISGAIATAVDGGGVQLMERQAQTFFYQLRGSVTSPKNIVILAIDESSLDQGKLYREDPQNLAYFEPLQTWPWKREAYARVINRLMEAGAKSVAVDLVFDTPSSYGQADDEQLRKVLQEYAGRVTLAASYEEDETRPGSLTRLIEPDSFFQTNPMSVGSINFLLEPDGRIHRLASQYPKVWAQNNPELAKEFNEFVATVPSFDEAALQAARLTYPQPKGDNLFFYGPPGTFEQIPFYQVLDPENWNTYLQGGKYFKDKIVIIGPTATLFQDFHRTPFSEMMPGVEIHANAIATLLEGRSIAQAIPNAPLRGLLVLVGVAGTGFFLSRQKRWPASLGLATGVAIAWGGMSYLIFVNGQLILPTAIPIIAIALCGTAYGTIGAIRELLSKLRLRETFKHYSSSPIVQEIISQQNDLQDLLNEREEEALAATIGGRYKIIKRLSAGGFGETYIAEDRQRPGNPRCVVKQLRPASNNPKLWQLAKRLFITEAEILERLGKHDQIPQLLAYFEEAEKFYLVEELISGRPLTDELPLVVPLDEAKVIAIVRELLKILEFVHSQGVIHRDIKPDNIIRRQLDTKLVLIDFGAVKEIRTHLEEGDEQTNLTVGIGTKGYMPNEQAAGTPKFNSDIYAVGMIAIQALTVTHPAYFQVDPKTGEVIWQDKAKVSPEFAAVLNKMVRFDFRDRYQSAREVLEALKPLIAAMPADFFNSPVLTAEQPNSSSSLQDIHDATMPWSESSNPSDLQDSTRPWLESPAPSDTEDATIPWPESSTPPDFEDATRPWPESSTPSDLEEATTPLPESSTPPEPEDSTMPWPESMTPKPQSPSSQN